MFGGGGDVDRSRDNNPGFFEVAGVVRTFVFSVVDDFSGGGLAISFEATSMYWRSPLIFAIYALRWLKSGRGVGAAEL